jgi:hypothetical protein
MSHLFFVYNLKENGAIHLHLTNHLAFNKNKSLILQS